MIACHRSASSATPSSGLPWALTNRTVTGLRSVIATGVPQDGQKRESGGNCSVQEAQPSGIVAPVSHHGHAPSPDPCVQRVIGFMVPRSS